MKSLLLKFSCVALFVACALLTLPMFAAPTGPDGILTELNQPNGEKIEFRVFGDEFYNYQETTDGYTVVHDETLKGFCYAVQDSQKMALISSGILVTSTSTPPAVEKHLRESQTLINLKTAEMQKKFLGNGEYEKRRIENKIARLIQIGATDSEIQNAVNVYNMADYSDKAHPMIYSPAHRQISFKGSLQAFSPTYHTNFPSAIKGIVLIVDFSDNVGTVDTNKIANMMNQIGYIGDDNSNSVRGYYKKQSNGKLDLTQYVTPAYVRVPKTRAYYNGLPKGGYAIYEFVRDAVKAFNDSYPNVDLSDITTRTINSYWGASTAARSVSIYYAGPQPAYGSPLWPHRWSIYDRAGLPKFNNGPYVFDYQMTNIGTTPKIGTFCHESGHLVCDFNDYYDYGASNRYSETNIDEIPSAAILWHCLMGSGNRNNNGCSPADISPYLKHIMGWGTCVELTQGVSRDLSLDASDSVYYKYTKPGSTTEYFLIKNRYAASAAVDPFQYYLPARGVSIWHIDESVTTMNEYQQMTSALHYEHSLEQADGLFSMEKTNTETQSIPSFAKHYYSTATQTSFTPATTPNSNWWDGSPSGLAVTDISAVQQVATAKVSFGEVVTAPTVSPADATTFTESLVVTLTKTDAQSTLYYTLDGSTPDATSTPYTAPFTIQGTQYKTVVKAVAIREGYLNSAVATASYFCTSLTPITILSPKEGQDFAFADPFPFRWTVSDTMDVNWTFGDETGVFEPEVMTCSPYALNGLDFPSYQFYEQFNVGLLDQAYTGAYLILEKADDPAVSVRVNFRIGNIQTITVTGDTVISLPVNQMYQIEATGGASGNLLTYTSANSDIADVNASGLITPKLVGQTVDISINQAGGGTYLSAKAQKMTVTVTESAQINQIITVRSDSILMGMGTPDDLHATVNSGLPLTYVSDDVSVVEVSATGRVTPVGAGKTTIRINQPGNTLYTPAAEVVIHVEVIDYPPVEAITSQKEGVQILWETDPKGNTFEVLRSTTRDGTYEVIQNDYTPGNAFNDNKAVPGQTYFYKLRAKTVTP